MRLPNFNNQADIGEEVTDAGVKTAGIGILWIGVGSISRRQMIIAHHH